MISNKDWQEIIAKCQGVSKPNETAHILLAAATYMTDRAAEKGNKPSDVGYSGDSEFSRMVRGKSEAAVMAVFDELMETLSVISPKLHAAVMNKLKIL